MSHGLYDLSILSEMVYGDTDFMKELVDTFIEFAPTDTAELTAFAKAQNWEETSKKAHKLKSSIRTIGVTSLNDLILQIEMDSKGLINTSDLPNKITNFSDTLDRVLIELKKEDFSTLNNA